ncbi:MAG TPA: CinA family protein [Ottowia sp.]|nr:CinA family protein [Ottowia sp.]
MLPKQELSALTGSAPEAKIVHDIAALLTARGWLLTTAESCTGGLVAAACTELAGSSLWFERGIVSYSNAAKSELLGVPPALIARHGAVSEPVVRAMAEGALAHARAQVSVALTGIAGPTGGSADKPVGTVWFGWCVDGRTDTQRCRFDGDRQAVRVQAALHALRGLAARLAAPGGAATPLT